MCGIIAYIGQRAAQPLLLEGLERLEYRGYDSAGLALLERGKFETLKAVGKVGALVEKTKQKPSTATMGIAHTRWATHGKPSERNAHPHRDHSGNIRVVHNGIIENYESLKAQLRKKRHVFFSDTDSEVIAHLLEEERKHFPPEEAFTRMLQKLNGTYGLVVMMKDEERLFAARMGSPLVIGVGDGEFFVASDVSAMLASTRRVLYLEDGEWAVLDREGYRVQRGKTRATKPVTDVDWDAGAIQKAGYPHFMLKEIFEQPESVHNAFRGRMEIDRGLARLGGLRTVKEKLRSIKRLILVSCGTSYHAGLLGEYMIEEYAGVPVEVEYASEFRYRKPLLDRTTAVLVISQSGETADTLAALREAKEKGALTLGIVNVVGSTIARETDAGVYNHAGPEVSVASTKAFTSQLTVLALLAVYLGRQRSLSLVMGQRILREIARVPEYMRTTLRLHVAMKRLARRYRHVETLLILGRKYHYPLALEGALKIKEIAYVNAQGYPTGEMKHGPIALLDRKSLVILLAPEDSVFEKNLSGLQEVLARGAQVLLLSTKGRHRLPVHPRLTLVEIPKTLEMLQPLLSVLPLQLFAYYLSVLRGLDVDQPRNLAKSVTVE